MRVIVAGSRDNTTQQDVDTAIADCPWDVQEIVSGTARGVDRFGEAWAYRNFMSVKQFPADWDKYGKGAGFRRNAEMAEYADALIAVWDGESRGTAHMIKTMEALGKPVYVHKVD
jgi:hypothetical protein